MNCLPPASASARRRALLYAAAVAAAFAIALLTRTPSPTDWDSWVYASLAARAKPSGLCLGRWWFLLFMRAAHGIGAALGLELVRCYIAMQLAVALMSAAAMAALVHLTLRLTGRLRTAAIAACMAAASPTWAAYSSAVMTETPTLLLLSLALIAWEATLRRADRAGGASGLALLAGVAFGVAGNMREPALVFSAWPVVSCFIDRPRRRWRLLGSAAVGMVLAVAFGVSMAWAWSGRDPRAALAVYAEYMRVERSVFGFRALANVYYVVRHLAVAFPLGFAALAAIGVREGWRRIARSGFAAAAALARNPAATRLKWLALSACPYLLVSWYNPDVSFNYRLLLPLAWMLVPAAALAAERLLLPAEARAPRVSRRARRAVAAGLAALCAWPVAVGVVQLVSHFRYAAHQDELFRVMRRLPESALVIPGPGSPIGLYLHEIEVRPYWEVMDSDPEWTPELLTRRAGRHLAAGRDVLVNLDPAGWTREYGPNPEWRAVRDMARRFEKGPAEGPFRKLLGEHDVVSAFRADSFRPGARPGRSVPHRPAGARRARPGAERHVPLESAAGSG
jgi:hypothetical protein